MTGADFFLGVALMILLVFAVTLGAAEAALLRVPRVRVEVRLAAGERRAGRLLSLLDNLPRVLNTVLLVVLLVQIGAATVVAALAGRWVGNLGVMISSIALTVVLFVYAEAIPKTYAMRHPYRVARSTAPLVSFLVWILRPIVTVLLYFADIQSPGSGVANRQGIDEAELRRLVSDAAAAGTIDPTDRLFIERAFMLGDRAVGEILTPRIEIVAVPARTTVREALDTAIRSGHRRLPVHGGDLDNILGVVRLRDLAAGMARKPDTLVTDLMTRELVVPETKRVVDLLAEMQTERIHLALVVDEHGGTAGIVTIEDVAAELVGSVSNEGELLHPSIRQLSETEWRVDAGTDLVALSNEIRVALDAEGCHTIGGLVTRFVGRIPHAGETFDLGDVQVRIVEALPRRIVTVDVVRPDQIRSS